MRKTLLFTIVLLLMAGMGSHEIKAQACSPSPLYVAAGLPGLWPNPATGATLKDGKEGVAYSDMVTVIVPADTTLDLSAITGFPGLPTLTVSINSLSITAVSGLPSGLNYACDTSSCAWPGDDNGCVGISGTPTAFGAFNVDFEVSINVDVPASVPVIGGGPFDTPAVPVGYDLLIDPAIAIDDELNPNNFELGQSVPNPTEGISTIFFTKPIPGEVTLEVYNLLGNKVHASSFKADSGLNSHEFNGSGLRPGVYFYTLSDGNMTHTQRLVISR